MPDRSAEQPAANQAQRAFFEESGYFNSAINVGCTIFPEDGDSEVAAITHVATRTGAILGSMTTLAALKNMGVIDEDFDKAAFDAVVNDLGEKMLDAKDLLLQQATTE